MKIHLGESKTITKNGLFMTSWGQAFPRIPYYMAALPRFVQKDFLGCTYQLTISNHKIHGSYSIIEHPAQNPNTPGSPTEF